MTSNSQRLDQIRELLSAHPQGLSVTEIAAALGVNKNSTGRSLDTLYAAGEIRMRRFGMAKLYTSAARMPLSAMMSLPSDLILIVDEDRIITFINDPFLSLLGLTRDQALNRHVTTIRGIAPDMEGLEAAFVDAAEKGEVREMVRLGEEERIFLRRCVPVTLESGAPGTAMIMEDLTAQIRAEQALHEQVNQFAEVIENLQDIYYQTDMEGTLTYANRQILPMLGYDSMDQVLGRPATSFWTEPEKRKKFLNLIMKRGAINDFDTTLIRADGTQIPVSVSSHLRTTGEGEFLGLGGTIRDISRRKESDEEIQVLSAHNRAMIEANLDPIAAVDRNGTITDVNEATVAITGYTREELIGTPFSRYFADQTMARQVFGEVIFSGQIRNRYVEVMHSDGHRTPALLNAALWKDKDGAITGVFASARDITNQQRMDRDLARSEGLLQMMAAVFVHSAQPIAIGYPEGRFAYANPALCRMLGYTEKELKERDWSTDLTPPEWQETETAGLERLAQTGEPQEYRKEFLHRDGHRVPVEIVAHLVRETCDLPLSFCMFVTDISRSLRAEEQQIACELRFQHLLDAAPIGIWATNNAGRTVLVNRPLAAMLGYSIEELEGRLAIEVLEEAGLGEKYHPGAILARGEENIPTVVRQRNGGLIEALLTTAPITDQQGAYQGMVGFILDTTQEKAQVQALTEAKRRLCEMISRVPLMALQFDETRTLVSCNDLLIARTGWTRNQVLGRDWHLHMIPPDETGDLGLTLQEMVARGDLQNWAGPMLTADGRVLLVRWTCLVHYDDRQQFAGLTCLGEDITDQHLLAGMLSKAGEQVQDLVESIPYPTVLIDNDWTIIRANQAFSTVLQYSVPKRPKKLSLLSIFSPTSRPAVTALLNREEEGHETCTTIRENGEQIGVTVQAGSRMGNASRVLMLMTSQNAPDGKTGDR